eukprot:CAMPEP_0170514548 /NCGR_PEP_ID=MMETSP0209-20121228/1124_1 /TAXON_ID=665100 ORGANISM="Litonotus pictus, Strain P1" /NCGR_SAMPLE_ID=MMETSP0209 /ASSEMBLY_ACC=CAM_ASM_000301 /LENGTH=516 /DNA_ID=CAMNT_0010798689 /DNA_START=110 /DNA_END=1660 /DNA_ORIENTATION=+
MEAMKKTVQEKQTLINRLLNKINKYLTSAKKFESMNLIEQSIIEYDKVINTIEIIEDTQKEINRVINNTLSPGTESANDSKNNNSCLSGSKDKANDSLVLAVNNQGQTQGSISRSPGNSIDNSSIYYSCINHQSIINQNIHNRGRNVNEETNKKDNYANTFNTIKRYMEIRNPNKNRGDDSDDKKYGNQRNRGNTNPPLRASDLVLGRNLTNNIVLNYMNKNNLKELNTRQSTQKNSNKRPLSESRNSIIKEKKGSKEFKKANQRTKTQPFLLITEEFSSFNTENNYLNYIKDNTKMNIKLLLQKKQTLQHAANFKKKISQTNISLYSNHINQNNISFNRPSRKEPSTYNISTVTEHKKKTAEKLEYLQSTYNKVELILKDVNFKLEMYHTALKRSKIGSISNKSLLMMGFIANDIASIKKQGSSESGNSNQVNDEGGNLVKGLLSNNFNYTNLSDFLNKLNTFALRLKRNIKNVEKEVELYSKYEENMTKYIEKKTKLEKIKKEVGRMENRLKAG